MIIYSHNLAEKLFGFAHSREFLKRNTDLCEFVDDPNLKLDIDLAIDFNSAIRGDLDAAERFSNTLILSSAYIDVTTAEFYKFKMENYPVFRYHIDRINYTFNNLDNITSSDRNSFANSLKNALKDCLNSPCNLFAPISDSVGMRARVAPTMNTTTLPAFSEIKDSFFNVLGGVSDTIFKKVPEVIQTNIVEMAQLTQRAWSTSVDMMFSKDPDVKNQLIQKALGRQPLNSDSVGYRYVPDVRTYFNASTMASNILSKVAQDLGGCYNRAQHAYRYQPYNSEHNLGYTANVGINVKIGDEQGTQNFFGQYQTPGNIRSNRDLSCRVPGTSPFAALDPNVVGTPLVPGSITVDGRGFASEEQLREYLKVRLQSSSLIGKKLPDGSTYGVSSGTVDEWTDFFVNLAKAESSLKVTTRNDADPGGSLGLFQVSTLDGRRYGANPNGTNWTENDLFNPVNNAHTAVTIFETQVGKTGRVATSTGKGAGGYFAATSMNKVARAAR